MYSVLNSIKSCMKFLIKSSKSKDRCKDILIKWKSKINNNKFFPKLRVFSFRYHTCCKRNLPFILTLHFKIIVKITSKTSSSHLGIFNNFPLEMSKISNRISVWFSCSGFKHYDLFSHILSEFLLHPQPLLSDKDFYLEQLTLIIFTKTTSIVKESWSISLPT